MKRPKAFMTPAQIAYAMQDAANHADVLTTLAKFAGFATLRNGKGLTDVPSVQKWLLEVAELLRTT